MNNRLTIRNYEKIRGLCYYGDDTWEPLQFTHQKQGGKAHIEHIEKTDDHYLIRLTYIQPQPDSAIICILRNGKEIAGKRMWRVEMIKRNRKKNRMVVNEFWTINQFEMDKLLMSIRIGLID